MKPADIDRFFEDLNRRLNQPVRVLLTGGAAAILLGVERATFDIDFEVALSDGAWDAFQKAIADTANSTGIAPQYAEDIGRWSSIAMPTKKNRLYRRFDKVEVRILDPGLWAIGKLARFLSTDIQDLRTVLKASNTRPKAMAKLWGTALGISPPSSSQVTFRKQVETFVDNYAKEIWGAQTQSEELKRLFVEAAKKARKR